MTASPERRDASALVSVSIRHAAVWFNQRRPGSGRSGNIPLLICWWEDAIPLHEGPDRWSQDTHVHTRERAITHTGSIPRQHERKRDTTSACRQTGARTPKKKKIARKPHARASAQCTHTQTQANRTKHAYQANAPISKPASKTPAETFTAIRNLPEHP